MRGGASKSQSPEIKGESKRGILKVYGMLRGAGKSQSPEIKGESKRRILTVYGMRGVSVSGDQRDEKQRELEKWLKRFGFDMSLF